MIIINEMSLSKTREDDLIKSLKCNLKLNDKQVKEVLFAIKSTSSSLYAMSKIRSYTNLSMNQIMDHILPFIANAR